MRKQFFALLAGSSMLALASPATAQTAQSGETGASESEAIVVTARRRDELLQDVPLTVNAVSGDQLEDLNIRDFKDIATVVPGLAIEPNRTASAASLRGVRFDPFASGNSGTVEFYQNDVAVASNFLVQSMYDVGQIEVLRGPQGTLRGKASPSGSITVTTRRPDLYEAGGYLNTTFNDIGGINAHGGVSIPLIENMLAIRVAGLFDENENDRVTSIYGGNDPIRNTNAGRVSLLFQPRDNLSFNLIYSDMVIHNRVFTHVESANIANPALAASPVQISAEDRRSTANIPELNRLEYETWNWQVHWGVMGQNLDYVGGHNVLDNQTLAVGDTADFFGPTFPLQFQNYLSQDLHSSQDSDFHELRLSSDEPLFGNIDYVIGAFLNRNKPPTDLINYTQVLFGLPTPAVGNLLNPTRIGRRGSSEEISFFGNLNIHLGENTEVSVGARNIEYEATGRLFINGGLNPFANQDDEFDATVYSASFRHRFNENMMAYISYGTSWRPGIFAVGDFSIAQSPLERSFLLLPPEESDSVELGLKTNWMDNRVTANFTIFQQEFDNYPYRAPTGIQFAETQASPLGATRVGTFNFVSPVPVEVEGFEFEGAFQATDNWSVSGNLAYASSELSGRIACNDYNPRDGVPDASPLTTLTFAQIRTATGGDNISACNVTLPASQLPEWSGTLQSQYDIPLDGNFDAYVRGLVSYYGESDNDPTNALDNIDAYSLVNLYFGLRSDDGRWELALYGKNILDEQTILTRGATPVITPYNIGSAGQQGVTPYRAVSLTAPQEFGVNLRVAFGSDN